jgi:hypothetical protein
MDAYLRAYVKTRVRVDAGGRVWDGETQLEVVRSGGTKKVQLPNTKYLLTFEDLRKMGARVDVPTVMTLAQAGAEGRWREVIEEREKRGIPSNVYVANARTIQRAIDRGETPPNPTWLGRRGKDMTEVYDTVDEVVAAMTAGRWRQQFARGSRARRNKR